MTTNNTTAHTNCDHEATKAARAACRKARSSATALRDAAIDDLLATFASKAFSFDSPTKWVFYAARRFASYTGTDAREAAAAILDYFLPSGDEAKDRRRRENGYTITSDAHTMLSITLRAAS